MQHLTANGVIGCDYCRYVIGYKNPTEGAEATLNMVKHEKVCGKSDIPKFYMVSGALMCDREIPGLNHELEGDGAKKYYGGRYFVCETLSRKAGKIIAEALGGIFI